MLKLTGKLRMLVLWASLLSVPVPLCASPRILASPERVESLKKRRSSDKAVSTECNNLIRRVDEALRNGSQRLPQQELCLAFLLTGKETYVQEARDRMLRECHRDKWVSDDMLRREPPWRSEMSTASTAASVATLYDCFKDRLSEEDRAFIRESVFRLGILPTLEDWLLDRTRIHSLNSMGHNWWSHCIFNAGVACLAFVGEDDRAQKFVDAIDSQVFEWFDFGGDRLQNKPKTYDQGGMYESVGYAGVSNGSYLRYRLAWTNTYPDRKPDDIPYLGWIAKWYMDVCYPRSGRTYSVYFGDSNLTNNGVEPVKYLAALGYGTPDTGWYLNQFETPASVFDLLYPVDRTEAPSVPSIPPSSLYPDNGWGMLRSSWEKDATLLGVVSGHTWNHRHADCNSFVLFHDGEYLIKDAGNCSYGNPLYSSYYRQSEAHNVVLFDGQGQPKEQEYAGSMLDGHLQDLIDEGDVKYLMADGCGPMARTLSRNFRHFLWIDKVILVIDDLKAYDDFGQYEWLLHPEGEARRQGLDLVITNRSASVRVRPLFPETLIATGYDHDFPEKMKLVAHEAPIARDEKNMETYFSFVAPEKANRMKGVTAILLTDGPEDRNLPRIERLNGPYWIGLRITADGKTTDVFLNNRADGSLMHLNSIIDLGGFQTDAYLVAYSYPEGETPRADKLSRCFLCYGSFFREGKNSIFESLSKKTLLIRP